MASQTAEKRPIPKWLLRQEGLTTHGWKVRKRAQLRNVRAAFNAFRLGCAHTPGTKGEVGAIQDALKSLEKALSIKEWGR